MFHPKRFKLIRQDRGKSQADYADQLGVSRQFIHQLEVGDRTPNADTTDALCALTGVTPLFFERPVTHWISADQCNFRKQKTTSKTFANQIIARSTLVSEIVSWTDQHVDLPPVCIPHVELGSSQTPERAAAVVRAEWGLGMDAPIDSVTRIVENAGAVCVNAVGVSEKISALSVNEKRPLVLHNHESAQPTRLRFDMCHEFGHFVMHSGMVTGDDDTETQANQFAAEFLLPKAAFFREFPEMQGRGFNWSGLAGMKRRWGVSFRALVYRARELGVINAAQFKGANAYLSRRGYAKAEPYEPNTPERPEAMLMAAEVLRDHVSIYREDIAESLGLTVDLLEEVVGIQLPEKPQERKNVVNLRAVETKR
jgi:Zn-dependent peptidase ImmA (M78 family)